MKKACKPVSLLLSFIMIFSLFTIIPFTAGAATAFNDVEGYIPLLEPYIDKDGAYILGTKAHFERDGKNYAVNADGSVGEELTDLSLSYFDFALIDNDSAYQINLYTGPTDTLDTLVIPKTFNGKPITVLGNDITDSGNEKCRLVPQGTPAFKVVLNENITKITPYSFYTVQLTGIEGDTSGLCKIGAYAFSWANSSDDYKVDVKLDYEGTFTTGLGIFNNDNVTLRIKHGNKLSSASFRARSVNYVFTDDHIYGDPVWNLIEDNTSAAATFTCTDSRCGHQKTVSAESFSIIPEKEPYIDESGEYHLGNIAYVEINGEIYAMNEDGTIGERRDSVEVSYFDFALIHNDSAYQINYYTGPTDTLSELVIPKTFNDKPITVLGNNINNPENSKCRMMPTDTPSFTLVLNENITEITPYSFYAVQIKGVEGNTSNLKEIGNFAFAWANGSGGNKIDVKLDYEGMIDPGGGIFNNDIVTLRIKHATQFSYISFGDQSIEYIFTDAHPYGDPVWTWADDHSSATATFTCPDSRCGHQKIVSGDFLSIPEKEPYIDESGEYHLGNIAYVEVDGKFYAMNEDGTIGERRDSVEVSYFDFALIDNNSAYQINYYTGPTDTLSELVIPKTFNGKPITVLGNNITDSGNEKCRLVPQDTPGFTLVLNENITEITPYSFYAVQIKGVEGNTSNLNDISSFAFSWANGSDDNKVDVKLDYEGTITVGVEIFNHDNVTLRIKHGTQFSSTSFSARSVDYIFTDAHTYGDPVWNWSEDNTSATATFTCTDSRCNHQETVNATIASETKDGVVTYTATAEIDGNTYTDIKTAFADGIGASVVGHSISLDGDIAVNFYMKLSDSIIAHKDTAYMHFTIPTGSGTTEQDMFVKDARVVESGDKTYYVFKCRVAAKEMTSEIRAQLIDGDLAGTEYTYSVKEYADYLIEHADEREDLKKAAPLVKAMLNYGAHSQLYFDKNPGALANADLTDAEKALATPEISITDPVVNVPEGVTFEGATLSLKSETTLSLYFKSSDTFDFSCDGYTVEKATSGVYQIARIRGIKAKHIGDTFTLNVNGGTVTYSPLNYCKNVLDDDTTDEKLQNVVKALYAYWQAADRYFE